METIKIKDVTSHLERFAPPSYQESYDNSGLLTGDREWLVKGILLTLDCIESVVDEAIERNCNLIVAHHPIIFKGLKKITGTNYVERTIIKALKNDIAIYAIHTNLDNVIKGVNHKIAEKIGLVDLEVLSAKDDSMSKLVTFIPQKDVAQVMEALHEAGAGSIGNYEHCSFQILGKGTFRPGPNSNPHIGKAGEQETVDEVRAEVIFPNQQKSRILKALRESHPYEEVAYYLTSLDNANQEVGAGIIGRLPKPMEPLAFLERLKDVMNTPCIRYTELPKTPIERVAVCGGAGSFLLSVAKAKGASAYVSADFKYHEFFDAEGQILVADIGHYESEQFTKDLLKEVLDKKFPNFALYFSNTVTNPISYL